jgi:hypothetical protein
MSGVGYVHGSAHPVRIALTIVVLLHLPVQPEELGYLVVKMISPLGPRRGHRITIGQPSNVLRLSCKARLVISP